MNIMKNQLAILKNLKNRTVLTYVAIVVLAPLLVTDLVEYESLQKILEIVTQAVAILGIIDDPNTNHFLKN